MQEIYLQTSDLTDLLNLGLRTVQRLSQDGTFSPVPDPEDGRRKVYPLKETVQAYLRYQEERAAGKDRKDRMLALEEKKLEAEATLKESQSELHRMKAEIAQGKYLSVDEVQMDYARFFVSLKKFLLAIPSRVTGMIAGYVDPVTTRAIEKDISTELQGMMDRFVVAGVQEGSR